MGPVREAKLNHFPGPKHLLELASEVELHNAQAISIEEILLKMKSKSVAEGSGIVEPDCHLADRFASGQPSVAEARRIARYLGVMRDTLEGIHLLAHIESARELTGDLNEGYDRLRLPFS